MAWSTDESRRQAATMTMRTALGDECWGDDWTHEDRAGLLKSVRAQRYSGLDRYPSTMGATRDGLMAAIGDNGLADLWDAMDYRMQGAMLVAFKAGYDAGRSDG